VGLILDSSVLIALERSGWNARQALTGIAALEAGEEIAISVVTLVEMAHGVARANTAQHRAARRQFLNEVMIAVPVHPVAIPIALRAGEMDGESMARGITIPLSDLLIGVTALEMGYRVATSNIRHFRMIQGLGILAV